MLHRHGASMIPPCPFLSSRTRQYGYTHSNTFLPLLPKISSALYDDQLYLCFAVIGGASCPQVNYKDTPIGSNFPYAADALAPIRLLLLPPGFHSSVTPMYPFLFDTLAQQCPTYYQMSGVRITNRLYTFNTKLWQNFTHFSGVKVCHNV